MDVDQQTPTAKWTWADLYSSYRFWGLVFYFIAFAFSQYMLNANLHYYMRFASTLSTTMIATVSSAQFLGMFLGAILAWIASRTKNCYMLYLFGALILLGLYLLCFNIDNVIVLILAEVLIGLGQGAIILIVPAFIAGAVGTAEAFVLSFGFMATLKLVINPILQVTFPLVIERESLYEAPWSLFMALSIPAIIGMLFLLPVKGCLFNEAPRLRQVTPKRPEYREPIVTFFLFLVPFYYIFWFVKIHAEIRSFTQSPTLLTPTGAGWSVFMSSIIIPVVFSTLNDNLRTIIESHGQQARYKTWLIILFAFLLPPVSAALIQSQMNEINGNLKRVEPLS